MTDTNVNVNSQEHTKTTHKIKTTQLVDDTKQLKLHYFGLVFFIVVFCVCIPYLMYNFGFIELLEMYFPNLDLLATCLNFKGGPFNLNMFLYLFSSEEPLVGYLSFNIIGLLSVVGLFAVVLKQIQKSSINTKNLKISRPLATATIMLIITFFFPNRYINQFNELVYGKTKETFTGISEHILWGFTFIMGIILSFLIIKFETFVNKTFINDKLAVFISNFIN